MEIKNCLYCLTHYDNRKDEKCISSRHCYKIKDTLAEKYKRDIEYIKKEALDRHIIAALGSAGYTFLSDIRILKNFAYSIGDKDFYKELENLYI